MVISDKPGLVTYISLHNLVNIVLCRLTTPLYKQCGVCELNYQRIRLSFRILGVMLTYILIL